MTLAQDPIGLVAASAALSAAVGVCMRKLGNRTVASWALPVAGAILYGGVGYAFNLPDWLIAGGFLATPLVFHKNVKDQLTGSAKYFSRLELPDGKGFWAHAPMIQENTPSSRLAAWELGPEKSAELFLDFEGAEDEEYRVLLNGRASRGRAGVMSIGASGGVYEPDPVLKDREPLSGIPGLSENMIVRALPEELGFLLLDLSAISAAGDILLLRTKTREVRIHVSGPRLSIVSSEIFSKAELRRLLISAGILLRKISDVGGEESFAGA